MTSHRWRRRRCRRCGAANKKRLRQRRAPHTHTHRHTYIHYARVVVIVIIVIVIAHTHVQRTRSRDRPRLLLARSPALSFSVSSPLPSLSLSVSLLPGPHTFAKKFFDVLFIYFVKHRSALSRESFAAKLSLYNSLSLSLSLFCLFARIQSVMKSKSNSYQLQRPAPFRTLPARALELCPKAVKISANCKKYKNI